MNKVLRKRVPRELKKGFLRYLILCLLVSQGMFIVVSLVGAAETVIQGSKIRVEENKVEDGQFSVFIPLTEEQERNLTNSGITLEKMFSVDVKMKDGSVLRLMKNRKKINLIDLDEGRLATEADEVVLEKRYCEEHGILTGDTIELAGDVYRVTGIGSVPDYDTPIRKMSDPAAESNLFGLAFVTEEQYEQVKNDSVQMSEEFCYAYRLNGKLTHEELKEKIKKFEFDYQNVTDPYFCEIVNDAMKDKNDITDGINKLYDGAEKLTDGMSKLNDKRAELIDGTGKIWDAYLEQAEKELKDIGISVDLTRENYGQVLASLDSRVVQTKKQELTEVKTTLDSLNQFYQGVKEYASGVGEAYPGSVMLGEGRGEVNSALNEFEGGIGELNNSGKDMNDGVGQEFITYLSQVQGMLSEMGYPVELTMDNYEQVIGECITQLERMPEETEGATPQEMIATLQEMKLMLDNLKEYYCNGIAYNEGVEELYTGVPSFQSGINEFFGGVNDLEIGLSELNGGGAILIDSTKTILDTYLLQAQEALKEMGYTEQLTLENYAQKLDEVAAKTDAKELTDLKKDIDDLRAFYDGICALSDGIGEAYTGVCELSDGVSELKTEAEKTLNKYFKLEMDNLTSFVKAEDNPRILSAANDMVVYKQTGLVSGVVIIVLFAYVISVFVIHQIQKESSVIGALYALGAKKGTLIRHYITLPTIVVFIGSVIGAVIGFSDFGIEYQTADSHAYYSFPQYETVYPIYLIVYAVVMPPLVCMLINALVINKRLSQTALSLIRNEQKEEDIKKVNLGKLKFMTRFQIRQILREARTGLTVIIGMIISLLIFMMGMDCYVMCDDIQKASVASTQYEYMYLLKYPSKEVPVGGEACYTETLSKMEFGHRLDVTIYGIDDNNKYFNTKPVKGKSSLVIGKSMAQKYRLKVGDKVILSDGTEGMDYAFTVEGICDYSVGLSAFMDIGSMRELFGQDEKYYNMVLSDKTLDIEEGRLYSVTTKEDVYHASSVFVDLMKQTIQMLVVTALLIFCCVMFLMLNVMVDRATFGISLVKIFGFRTGEIHKLYLSGNTVVVVIGALIGIPVSKAVVDAVYPWMFANTSCGMNLTFSWQQYVEIFIGIMAIYFVINSVLVWKLKRISLVEVLRNRE